MTSDAPETPRPPDAQSRPIRVAAVTPCLNAPDDFRTVLDDLVGVADALAPEGVELSIIAVDNASEPPLGADTHDDRVTILRLPTNRGGSGGYNAGLSHAMLATDTSPDWLWMVDSDARVTPETLRAMLKGAREDVVAVGAAIAWPTPDDIFEVGGVIRSNGSMRGLAPGERTPRDGVIDVDYSAACCLLVRAEAAERHGLMPDVFLNGDDSAWCLRLQRRAGQRVVVAPDAVAVHPRFDRAKGWPRYYATRNAFGVIEATGRGGWWRARARARRALTEACRAAGQTLIGRDAIGAMHLRGLADAASGRWPDVSPSELDTPTSHPLERLAADLERVAKAHNATMTYAVDPTLDHEDSGPIEAALAETGFERRLKPLRRGVLGVLTRALAGPRADIVVASPKGRPPAWMGGRHALVPLGDRYELHEIGRQSILDRGGVTLLKAPVWAIRFFFKRPRVAPNSVPRLVTRTDPDRKPSLSIIVLSYNRREALAHTLERLTQDRATSNAEIIVVDNASSDASADHVRAQFPGVRVIALDQNIGVEAFNTGVEAATREVVLILDDDAWPEPAAVDGALRELAADPTLGAVPLHPKHPQTGRSEWPFARAAGPWSRTWPVMGCGNFVRRAAWRALAGYEGGFFLYRNDTDLALKVLGAGMGVGFDPSWVVWHDSPQARRKGARWFRMATRNWVWVCRRHGRGLSGLVTLLAGWLWAHKLAGLSPSAHARVISGVVAGSLGKAPPLPPTVSPSGRELRDLFILQTRYRSSSDAPADSTTESSERHSA